MEKIADSEDPNLDAIKRIVIEPASISEEVNAVTHRQVTSDEKNHRVEQAGGCYKLFDRFITILGGAKKARNGSRCLRANFMQSSSQVYLYFHHIC